MEFSGFAGNPEVKAALGSAFASGRFPHAILLQGEAGTGKRTLAWLIAAALVCQNPSHAPCGECPACIRSKSGNHPDIHVEEGSGKTRSISVDSVRTLTGQAYIKPNEATYNVFLLFIDNKITEIVQNKLLKLIEEPPEAAVFIFTCPSAEGLLPTIRSRVQIYTLKPPSVEESAEYIESRENLSSEEALKLSGLCGGNIGKMLEERSGGDMQKARDIAAKIAGLLSGSGEHELLAVTAPLIKNRELCALVLRQLNLIFRDACVMRSGGKVLLGSAEKQTAELSKLPLKRLMRLWELPDRYRARLEGNANMTLLVTAFCGEMKGS